MNLPKILLQLLFGKCLPITSSQLHLSGPEKSITKQTLDSLGIAGVRGRYGPYSLSTTEIPKDPNFNLNPLIKE
jgi:hypothetical protein